MSFLPIRKDEAIDQHTRQCCLFDHLVALLPVHERMHLVLRSNVRFCVGKGEDLVWCDSRM